MAYFAPYLDSTGIHIPTYEDRLEALLSSYRMIFGAEVNLSESSPDYQLLSVFARALDDLTALLVSLFASRNPAYASGAALDLLMPLMGLTRSGATHSSVLVTLTGTPGAHLSPPPRFLDSAGYIWACQGEMTLDENGTITVQAICETAGSVSAAAGTVTGIVTPVAGLTSVTNPAAANPGEDAETDASARYRMRLAAAAPSVSMEESLRSALLSLANVKDCRICVNDGSETDEKGIPGHSICAVLYGGSKSLIAQTIFLKKAPGIGTYGSITATVTDSFGYDHQISFKRSASMYYTLNIRLTPRAGFDEETMVPAIRAAVYAYVSGLGIGEELVIPALYGIAYSADTAGTPTFLITDISAAVLSTGTFVRDVLTPAWDARCALPDISSVSIVIDE